MPNILKALIVSFLLSGSAALPAPAYPPAVSVAQSDPQTSQATQVSTGSNISSNWSGYVANAGTYSEVGSSWVVPTPTASQSLTSDAAWVGIGGVKNHDLIQAGTQAMIENGRIVYSAWYETLPQAQHAIPLTISGGDSVTVSLKETSPGEWHLSFADNTTGKSYEKDIAYTSTNSSAEWIEEMPTLAGARTTSYIPLDSFGTITFTNAYAVVDGVRKDISDTGAAKTTMIAGRSAVATPSGLTSDGAGFSIARSDAVLTSRASVASGMRGPARPARGRRLVITFTF